MRLIEEIKQILSENGFYAEKFDDEDALYVVESFPEIKERVFQKITVLNKAHAVIETALPDRKYKKSAELEWALYQMSKEIALGMFILNKDAIILKIATPVVDESYEKSFMAAFILSVRLLKRISDELLDKYLIS